MKTQSVAVAALTLTAIKASTETHGILVARKPSALSSVRFSVRFAHGIFIVRNIDQGSYTTWASLQEVKTFIKCHN